MNEWINEWMNEWMNERINEWMKERMNKWKLYSSSEKKLILHNTKLKKYNPCVQLAKSKPKTLKVKVTINIYKNLDKYIEKSWPQFLFKCLCIHCIWNSVGGRF